MLTHESFFVLCFGVVYKKMVWQIFLKKIKNSVDKVYGLCYYIYVAYDGNKLNTVWLLGFFVLLAKALQV